MNSIVYLKFLIIKRSKKGTNHISYSIRCGNLIKAVDHRIVNKFSFWNYWHSSIKTTKKIGSYDNNKNFQFLSFKGIQPAIKVRKDSRCRKTNHYVRNKTVRSQKNNLQQWKDSVSYGQRWIAETVFSCMKRMFGEYVAAIRFENMVKEMILKASLYNWFQSITVR